MSEEIASAEIQPEPIADEGVSEEIQDAISEELGEGEEAPAEEEGGEIPIEGEEGEIPSEENQAELKKYIRKLKLKVNGVESEEELPFDIDPEHAEYLQKKFQMAAAGQEAMRSKKEIEKEREAERLRLTSDPYSVLEELGLDPDELAELRIQQRIEEMQRTPEQIKEDEMKKEVEELRAQLKEQQEAKQEAESQKAQKEAEVELSSSIKEAISAHTNLPQEPLVIRKVADAMLWAMDNGYPDVKAHEIAPIVEKEITKEFQKLVEMLPENALEMFIGKKNMERMRKIRITKSKQVPKSPIVDAVKPKAEIKKPEKKLSFNDFINTSFTKGK